MTRKKEKIQTSHAQSGSLRVMRGAIDWFGKRLEAVQILLNVLLTMGLMSMIDFSARHKKISLIS
jgi:hypothetical protein